MNGAGRLMVEMGSTLLYTQRMDRGIRNIVSVTGQ
jgi:hypothetical protein